MKPEQANEFLNCAEKGLPVISHDIAHHHQAYNIFNREYPWSPSCNEFEEYAWVNAHIKTDKKETVTETIRVPDISVLEAFIYDCCDIRDGDNKTGDIEFMDDEEETNHLAQKIQYKEETIEREIERDIGEILYSTTNITWEGEYDASKEDTISQSFPCGILIKRMGLRQMDSDGFFYDAEGKLAAFDTELTQKVNSVVVRKDIIDSFLSQTGLKLVWLVDAEKEIHAGNYSIISRSDWEAVFVYEEDTIVGDIHFLPEGNSW